MASNHNENCEAFVCTYIRDNICRLGLAPCQNAQCTGYYNYCSNCATTSCKNNSNYQETISTPPVMNAPKTNQTPLPAGKKVYAVKNGRKTGIFYTWADCKAQIDHFSNAKYKSFESIEEANAYLGTMQQAAPERPFSYVDGSYYNGVYGYGGFVEDENGQRHLLQGKGSNDIYSEMHNVAGELAGAIAAIKFAMEQGYKHLTIYYDYSGIEAWATGEWKAYKKGTIEYQNFVRQCPVKLYFKKVKGHSGVSGNELADQMAKKAVGL